MAKLTDKEIAAYRYPDHKGRHADGGGLFLEVIAGGRKRWLYRYRIKKDEKWNENTLILGDYPTLTLAKARIEHMRQKAILAAGGNPSTARKEARTAARQKEEQQEAVKANSFQTIALEWIALQEPRWSASHTQATRNTLQANVFPYLGDTPVDKINPPDVLEIIRRIEDRGCGEMAAKTLQRIRCVCRYAVQTGRAMHNPASDMQGVLKAKKTISHAALKKEELPDFFKALHDGDIHQVTKAAMLFTILTAARSGETRLAVWDEIDVDSQLWTIPAERMKMGSAHKVPVVDGIECLRQVKQSWPKVEVILLTAHASVQSGIEGMESGAFDYCLKPIDVPDLLDKLELAAQKALINKEKSEISNN